MHWRNLRIVSHEVPKQPWAKVGMDLFQCRGKHYLMVVDYLTDFFEFIELFADTTAPTVILEAKKIFARHGIPIMVQTDGGSQGNFYCFPGSGVFNTQFRHHITAGQTGKQNRQSKLPNEY